MPPKKGKGKKNKGKKAAAPAAAKRVNPSLAPGVTRFSRSAINKKKGAYKVKAANGGKWPSTPAKAKPAPADPAAAGRFYTTEDKPRPMKSTKANRNPTKLKAGLTPVRNPPVAAQPSDRSQLALDRATVPRQPGRTSARWSQWGRWGLRLARTAGAGEVLCSRGTWRRLAPTDRLPCCCALLSRSAGHDPYPAIRPAPGQAGSFPGVAAVGSAAHHWCAASAPAASSVVLCRARGGPGLWEVPRGKCTACASQSACSSATAGLGWSCACMLRGQVV
jgi:hypothetical protein